jgi:hypothetical protein
VSGDGSAREVVGSKYHAAVAERRNPSLGRICPVVPTVAATRTRGDGTVIWNMAALEDGHIQGDTAWSSAGAAPPVTVR